MVLIVDDVSVVYPAANGRPPVEALRNTLAAKASELPGWQQQAVLAATGIVKSQL